MTTAFRLKWDVFLSFRGEDTRDTITDHLYTALRTEGVRVFRDNDALNRGDEIAPGLQEAIEDSAAAIVIISPDYASSRWCVEELARICHCRRLILPVFYGVDPSDVRRQRGPFEASFRRLSDNFSEEDVQRWREAMKTAGGISGWVFPSINSEEQDLIRNLVRRVLEEISNTPVNVGKYHIGLDSRVDELMRLLSSGSSTQVQVLGLYGLGGVGKTTLAKALYNKLVTEFESRCFISNVREISGQPNGLVALQNEFICELSFGNLPPVDSHSAAAVKIRQMIRGKKVLVVLDDVDNVSQLNGLVGGREWFDDGSRIIITTRNQDVLVKNKVDFHFEVKELQSSDSLKLFSYHALGREKPAENFYDLSKQIVGLAGGLPLALEVFGSFLFDKRKVEEWKDALQKLKQIRPHHLQDLLKISFDGLDEEEKSIFLDIACFFVKTRMKKEDAIDIWKGCGFRGEIAVTILMARCLIKITEDNELWMHDQIRDMGRQIVQNENLEDSGMRSRLWDRDEITRVLKDGLGTRNIQGIFLDFEKKNFVNHLSAQKIARNDFWETPNYTSTVTYLMETLKMYRHRGVENREDNLSTKSFEAMIKLRMLQINYAKMEGKFKHMPAEIKWLQWRGCPLQILPPDFCPRELAVLDLSESKVEQLWVWRWWNWQSYQVARNLRVMNLRGCYKLTAVPDLSGHQALEKLTLERCSGLIKIHKSVGDLSNLLYLNLRDCPNLSEFPSEVSGLKQLESLILSGCAKLKELPEDLRGMKSLRELLIDGTAIAKLPESIFHLTRLERLSLDKCRSLKQLPLCIGRLATLKELSLYHSAIEEIPHSIGLLTNLEKLDLMWCQSLTSIPDSVGNLKLLIKFLLGGSSIQELPTSIGLLPYLKNLSVGGCHYLTKLPVSIEGLGSIVDLQLDGTSITYLPDQIGSLKMLEKLEMRNCKSLRALPDSIGSIWTLTTLIIVGAEITGLPESVGMLENLIFLTLNKCKQLCRLPTSIGNLKSLHHLLMKETAVTELPESFGMLSNLMTLHMAKSPYLDLAREIGHTRLESPILQERSKSTVVLPTSFSNLSLLTELDARAWKIYGKISDDFEKLSSLKILNLGHNDFHSLPSSLRALTNLKELLLPHCKELKSLPPLPSSLEELNAAHCTALESIFDLSKLQNLRALHLTNCAKLVDIPGLECLKSLRMLNMSGCSGCSATAKAKLSKDILKNLNGLSVPGSEIPDWFSQGVVHFSKRKNCVIKNVIVGVILSHEDTSAYPDPVISVEAQILRLNRTICSVDLLLMGVPKIHEDQFYLCRYFDYQPLVFNLLDGDKIQVVRKSKQIIQGLELKKSGIDLVFENDDDYDQDEDLLDVSQQSVSGKLATFMKPSERAGLIDEIGSEVQEVDVRGERWLWNQRTSFAIVFVVLSFLYPLLSWLW